MPSLGTRTSFVQECTIANLSADLVKIDDDSEITSDQGDASFADSGACELHGEAKPASQSWRAGGSVRAESRKVASTLMPTLVVLRHGESTWNAERLFTGWTDVELSEAGEAEARLAGRLLAD